MSNTPQKPSNIVPFEGEPSHEPTRGGIRSSIRQRAIGNAEIATRIRSLQLEALEQRLIDALALGRPDDVLETIRGDVLRLLADTENRGFGTPQQSIAFTGKDGGPLEMIHSAMTPEQAAEAYRKTLDGDG